MRITLSTIAGPGLAITLLIGNPNYNRGEFQKVKFRTHLFAHVGVSRELR